QIDRGLLYIRQIKQALGGDAAGQNEAVGKLLGEAEQALDTDAKLATSIGKAGNVLLPSVFQLGEPQGNPDKPLPAGVAKTAIEEKSGFSVPAIRGTYPLDSFS